MPTTKLQNLTDFKGQKFYIGIVTSKSRRTSFHAYTNDGGFTKLNDRK